MYQHTLMHYTMAHYKSNPIVLAVSSIYSQIPHTHTHCASFSIVIPVFSQRQKYLMSKSQNCAIQFIHQIPSFFVIIQKQKLSISSLSELVKKAESPKILLLNFFREIIFTKKLFSRKIQFFLQ